MDWASGCSGKTRYATRNEAQRACTRLNKRKNDGGGKPRPYWCEHCQGFHFGRLQNKILLAKSQNGRRRYFEEQLTRRPS